MVISTAVDVPGRVGDVKHLMEEHIFDNESRHIHRIERTTDRDVVVHSIMMPEYPICSPLRPRQRWPLDHPAEVSNVEAAEYLIEVINRSFRGSYNLSSASSFALCGGLPDRL